jgi:hypothetical protein
MGDLLGDEFRIGSGEGAKDAKKDQARRAKRITFASSRLSVKPL